MSSYAICCLSVIDSSSQANTPLSTECIHRRRCNWGANAYESTGIDHSYSAPHHAICFRSSRNLREAFTGAGAYKPQRALPVRSFDHRGRCDEPRAEEVNGSQVRHLLHVRLLAWLIPATSAHSSIPSTLRFLRSRHSPH